MRSRCPWLSASIASVAFSASVVAAPGSSLVVSWSEECRTAMRIVIELLVDGVRAYRNEVPVCLVVRNSLPSGKMNTRLQSEMSHFGEPRRTLLEADFWEASADPDAMILGVSFASKDRVWLNTLHVAFPDKQSETALAPGVVIRSYPKVGEQPPNKSFERTREG
jgi:hypothetical protein